MDVSKEFRTGVRAALLILMDEGIAAEERIAQATELLLKLPVPMLHRPHEEVMPTREILYVSDANGMPSEVVYQPVPDEGPLTEPQVLFMLEQLAMDAN